MSDELLRIDGSITLTWKGSKVCIECEDTSTAEGIFSVLKSSMELGSPVEFAWTGTVVKPKVVKSRVKKHCPPSL